MADYIYLLENRLSPAQQRAMQQVREISRFKGMNVFLTGGAVRDLTSGSPVRDLDISVQGNALKLKKDIEKAGGIFWGQHEPSQTMFFRFSGGVRVEISSTRKEGYPKPGKPVYEPSGLKEDLYRRDFTANAMALSLNDGSYGLLIDPMNGVADIESRYLRLVSNYGFIEDPARLLRAARLSARLGWRMDEKTQARYQTAKDEKYIASLNSHSRGYELEEIAHEEDPLKVLKALEADGWMKVLFTAWTSTKANIVALQALHDTLAQLQMQGVAPDASAASFQLLTGKMTPKEVQELKKLFPRQGFVAEIEGLDAVAKDFAKLLLGKEAAAPSATWKLMTSHPAEAVLWLAHTSKNAAVQKKFHDFFVVWPEARQKYPYLMMQEMRITPELPRYQELLQTLFFEMMDGKLQTPEEMKAFLEPFSPPAPPPPVHLRRPRAVKKVEGKRPRKKAAEKASPSSAGADEVSQGVAAASGASNASAQAEQAAGRKSGTEANVGIKPMATEGAAAKKAATGKASATKADPAAGAEQTADSSPGGDILQQVAVAAGKAIAGAQIAIQHLLAPSKGGSGKGVPGDKPSAKPVSQAVAKPISKPAVSAKAVAKPVAAAKAAAAKAAVALKAKAGSGRGSSSGSAKKNAAANASHSTRKPEAKIAKKSGQPARGAAAKTARKAPAKRVASASASKPAAKSSAKPIAKSAAKSAAKLAGKPVPKHSSKKAAPARSAAKAAKPTAGKPVKVSAKKKKSR